METPQPRSEAISGRYGKSRQNLNAMNQDERNWATKRQTGLVNTISRSVPLRHDRHVPI